MSLRKCFTRHLVVVFLVVIAVGLCFLDGCHGSEHCYRVDNRYVCYFTPYGANKNGEEWESAWNLCRRNGATLPVIENKTVQDIVEKYVKTQLPGQELWTAGKGMRSNQWLWLNGHILPDSKILDNHHFLSEIYDTHAIITDDLKLSGRYPSDKYHYVCQFSGTMCQSEGSIAFGKGCLKSISNETVRWYDARNFCVQEGGDLPTFETVGFVNRTQEVFLQLKDARGLWIGLRKTWWLWKRTDSAEELKYSNWFDHDNYLNRDCMILASNGKRWRQQFCMTQKKFFCQTVRSDLYSMEARRTYKTDVDSDQTPKMMITVGTAIPLVISIAVASVIIVRKCKICSSSGDRPKDRSHAKQWTKMNGPTGQVASSGLYADLRLQERNMKQKQIEIQSCQLSVNEQIWVAQETADD